MEWKWLDGHLDDLDTMLHGHGILGIAADLLLPRPELQEMWAKAAQIQEGFKGVRYPAREDRERAWARFNELRSELKLLSDRRKQEFQWTSERYRNEILDLVRSSRPTDLFGLDPVTVDEMKQLGVQLREAGQLLSQRKEEMLAEHKRECFEAIKEMRETHDAWWERLKKNRSQRHGEWRERIERNLERNREKYEKAVQALEYYRSKVDDLSDKIATAWNDDWAEGAQQRLNEVQEKVRDIEESIDRLEEWIREDEDKLNR